MSEHQRLLLIAPPNMSHSPAFNRAEALAKAMSASLYIVAFVYVDAFEMFDLIDVDIRKKAREDYLLKHRDWLEAQAQILRQRGFDVESEVIWIEHPLEKIFKYIRYFDVSLVIKGAHQESALKRIFFTPLDWHLLRDCAVPVHLVVDARNPLPRKILATVDVLHDDVSTRQLNDLIINSASKLASQCHAALQVLAVYDWSALYVSDVGVGKVPISVSPSYDERKEKFDILAERHSITKNNRHFIAGSPIKAIAEYATKSACDMLVMGTVTHRVFHKILGTTAESILYRPPCSVLAIKPVELPGINGGTSDALAAQPDVHHDPL